MRALILIGAAALAGCASTQSPPVTLVGADLQPLEGEWRGSYELPQLGRSGSIYFTLVAGEDHAHGDVIMVPAGSSDPIRRAPGPEGRDPDNPSPQAITIRVVRLRGDTVTGTLSPYLDPDCNCTAVATFRGVIHGNMIRGLFETRRASGTASGTWSVERHI
jgi:hypothetical protein